MSYVNICALPMIINIILFPVVVVLLLEGYRWQAYNSLGSPNYCYLFWHLEATYSIFILPFGNINRFRYAEAMLLEEETRSKDNPRNDIIIASTSASLK